MCQVLVVVERVVRYCVRNWLWGRESYRIVSGAGSDAPCESWHVVQVLVVAEDSGEPARSSSNTATVTVLVQRNDFAPEFKNQESYAATISETTGEGNEVTRLQVSDDDTVQPFNQISLSVIGDDSAASFFQVLADQRVVVRSGANLASERVTQYSLRVQAADGGAPARSSTVTVPITVIRNLHAPRFVAENQRATMPDKLAPGSSVASVEATDDDREAPNNVVRYHIADDTSAHQFFFINPNSGEISLLASVLDTEETVYRIKVVASDQGQPQKTAETFVEVTVIRDRGQLKFSQQNYDVTVTENKEAGQEVIRVNTAPNVSAFVRHRFLHVCLHRLSLNTNQCCMADCMVHAQVMRLHGSGLFFRMVLVLSFWGKALRSISSKLQLTVASSR